MIIDGNELGIEPFDTPRDIHVSADRNIYIADTNNNRIVKLDEVYQYVETIDSFLMDGALETFLAPEGVYVTEDNHVYIADTGNQRVVHLDDDYQLVKVIDEPESEMLTSTFSFRPQHVAVDRSEEHTSELQSRGHL